MLCPNSRASSAHPRLRCVVIAAALVFAASPLRAQDGKPPQASEVMPDDLDLGPFKIDDKNPENSVPDPKAALQNPLEMGYLVITLTERGEAAAKRGDHEKAARYYLALGKAAPDRALGFAKACEEFQAAGNLEKAVLACKDALARQGATVADQGRFVSVMLARQKQPLAGKDLEDVDAVIAELEKVLYSSDAGRVRLATLRCRVAVHQEDSVRLDRCAEEIANWPANSPEKFIFGSMVALHRHDWDGARAMAGEARKAKLPPELIAKMDESIEERERSVSSTKWSAFGKSWGAPLVLTAMLLLAAFVGMRKRAKSSPPPTAA